MTVLSFEPGSQRLQAEPALCPMWRTGAYVSAAQTAVRWNRGKKISPHGILAQPNAKSGRSGLPAEKMAQPPAKRQPVFTTIAELRPDTSGHNLTVKVRATERSPPRITHTLGARLRRTLRSSVRHYISSCCGIAKCRDTAAASESTMLMEEAWLDI